MGRTNKDSLLLKVKINEIDYSKEQWPQKFLWMIQISSNGKTTIEDIKKAYYIFKILGYIWFDASIPEDPDVTFTIFCNPTRLKDYPPHGSGEIIHLSYSCLKYLSQILKRPQWLETDGQMIFTSTKKMKRKIALIE